jgi:hypothetical protein
VQRHVIVVVQRHVVVVVQRGRSADREVKIHRNFVAVLSRCSLNIFAFR